MSKRMCFHLDDDAAALLAQQAPSASRPGKWVSELIRAYTRREETEAARHEELVHLNAKLEELNAKERTMLAAQQKAAELYQNRIVQHETILIHIEEALIEFTQTLNETRATRRGLQQLENTLTNHLAQIRAGGGGALTLDDIAAIEANSTLAKNGRVR